MRITVRQDRLLWYIYINNCRYKKGFNNPDEAYLSDEYNHFYKLIN